MELHLALDRSSRIALSLQIAHAIRDAIFTQRLAAGTRLPPTRELARRVQVSRMVVVEAYEWLEADGYVESRPGSGTYISQTLMLLQPAMKRIEDPPRRTDPLPDKAVAVNFRPGLPALDLFPRSAWKAALARAVRDARSDHLGYGPVEGLPRLRRVVAEYAGRTRGLPVTPERVVITVGAAQALDLLLRALAPIDRLAIEDPGPEPVRRLLQLHHIRPQAVPVDDQGLRVDLLPDEKGACAAVHVIPSHQYPTGWAMSLERRASVLAWAERHDGMVIEDDYDSEFRFDRLPPIALAALDRAQRVAYIGSFSKTLFPGLRLGYCVVPERLIGPLLDLKWFSDRCVPVFEQLALADWIESGMFEHHIRKMRGVYARRRDALLAALTRHFGSAVHVQGVPAGMHVYAGFDLEKREAELLSAALSAGVKVYPGSPCCMQHIPRCPSLIIGFGHLNETQIAGGIELLSRAFGGK
jgi:GntR family transcriptional regulator / MocR family aminotransferase